MTSDRDHHLRLFQKSNSKAEEHICDAVHSETQEILLLFYAEQNA